MVAVEVTPELLQMASVIYGHTPIKTGSGATLAQRLEAGPKLLIGSVSLGPGWSEWSQAMSVRDVQLEMATGIYLFDTMIQNWDRVIPNPNLLIKNDTYGMIDQEESFVDAAGTDEERAITPKPWKEGGVVNDVGEIDEHPLWRGIKRNKKASFGESV
ncbi:MAG: hypothetical protein RLN82_07610, partial [Pseudomonadales bacterium]